MHVYITEDARAFATAARRWLERRPVENSVVLSALAMARDGSPVGGAAHTFGWVVADGEVVGAMSRPAPYPASLTSMRREAVAALVRELAAREVSLAGVTAPARTATEFAARWGEQAGQAPRHERDARLYRCDRSVPVTRLPGGYGRLAGPDDAELLTGWFSGSLTGGAGMSPSFVRALVEEQISGGRLVVWEDGQPVGAVGYNRPVRGVTRIRPIHVVPEFRTYGYDRALVLDVTSRALRQSDTCISFTELSRRPLVFTPTTAVMDRTGYRPVHEVSAYRFW